MNKERRKVIADAIVTLEDIKSQIEIVRDEEQEAYDNLPESLQNGDKGNAMSEAIDNMESAVAMIDDCVTNLNDAGA